MSTDMVPDNYWTWYFEEFLPKERLATHFLLSGEMDEEEDEDAA